LQLRNQFLILLF